MNRYILIYFVCLSCFWGQFAQAQGKESFRFPVYGEAGLGWGQTLFFGNMKQQLIQSYGGAFNPNIGNNLMMGFYIAPENWRGLGIGSRIKGTFGTSVKGDGGDNYIFKRKLRIEI